MLGYLLRRVLAAIPVMGVVALFVFLLLRLTPGDPAAILAGDNASPEQLERIRVSLGLHEPLYTQFFTWVGKLLHGDLGVSLISNVPVLKMISQRLEPSISIALSTIILSILIAVPLGVIAAWKHGTWIDRFVMGLSVIGFSVPVFVIGYVLIQIFAIDLHWLPVQGFKSITAGLGPFLERIILPTCTLSFIYVALIARMTRASMLDVLGEDYVRTARAKGINESAVLLRHALRNAAVPVIRHRVCAVDIRRRRHRERVQPAGGRSPHRRCRAGARLSGDPGDDPADVGCLCPGQSSGRHRLHAARPQNPLLRFGTDGHRNPSRTVNPDRHAISARARISYGNADHRRSHDLPGAGDPVRDPGPLALAARSLAARAGATPEARKRPIPARHRRLWP
jgi:peptide/nickel transport system permease protein